MPWQLIYTSAPRGLLSGQSGFCTVGRSADLREALVQRLEQISSYHYLRVAEAATAHRNPAISAFRLLDLRGAKYCVLTRIQPCGLDFTGRTNHLAHHLVFQADELAQLPSPAAILRHWPGWLASWHGEPRHLEPLAVADFASVAKSFLPAETWKRMTGDAGRAAGLLETECIRGCYLVCPPGGEAPVLDMFCETLQLLNPNGQFPLRPWRHPFTTFMQAEDNPADFQWRSCQEGTPAYQQAVQRSAPLLPLAAVRVPGNSLVKVAREGLKPAAPPASAPDMRRLPAIRKPPATKPPASPGRQPDIPRPSSWLNLIRAYAAVKLRFSLMQQWFSNLPGASRASLGIFAVIILLFAGFKALRGQHHPAPDGAPPAPVAPGPAEPAPRSGNPGAPNTGQPPPATPPSAHAEPPNPKQLDWLVGDGPTFVFAASNFTHFEMPIDSIGRLTNLILRFDKYETRPEHIRLFVNINTWDAQPGAPMTVNARSNAQFSGQAASGLAWSFDYSDFLSKASPVVVETRCAVPLSALSFQFGFSSSEHGAPFRLLIVNESNPPPAMRLSKQWLRINRASFFASLDDTLAERLRVNFNLLQGLEWKLRPFVKNGQQTNYLYANWPAELLPRDGADLDFAGVFNSLSEMVKPSQGQTADYDQKLAELTKVEHYPLGKDLGVSDRLLSFARWTRPRGGSNTPAEFLNYLDDLRKEKEGTRDSDWVSDWPKLSASDDSATQAQNLRKLHDLWESNLPNARSNSEVAGDINFADTWGKLYEIESLQQQKTRLQEGIDKVQGRLNLVPASLDQAAYVGLFITDPEQRRPGLEIIRFQSP
jgi:hypothetical protein